jgi:hypothetical protein
VTVSDSTLYGNSSSGSGGGIYNAGGTVTINNATLSGNAAYYGGGVYNAGGTVAINASAISCAARFGGGIYNAGGTVTVSTSSVSGNAAYHADYPWEGGNGGGIYNSGTLTISHSNVTNNSADPYFGSGGGIYNDVNGFATVKNSSNVIGNTASDAGADVQNSGALYLDQSSTIAILSGYPANPI